MHDTLIIPTENSPSLRDIKRSLLTFGKVILVDPADRDVIPPNAWMSSIIGIPLMGINTGPVRPLGKVASYDDDFQQLMEDIRPAQQQGLVEVVSTYSRQETERATIGAVLTGGYPLNPQFVMAVYRSIASNQELLASVLDDAVLGHLQRQTDLASLILKGMGDGAINQIPALPNLELDGLSDDATIAQTAIARGRLGALVKFTGYCESKQLVPSYVTDGYTRAMSTLLTNTRNLLVNESDDAFWLRRNRVLDLGFETLLEPDALDRLSLDQVITLRTKEWGHFEETREQMFDSVFELANAGTEHDDFEKFIAERLVDIRKTASEIETQRKSIAFRIKCDLGAGSLGAGLSLLTLQAPLNSVAAILALGGVWALQRAQTYGDELIKLKNQEREAERGAGFAMSRFFSQVNKRA